MPLKPTFRTLKLTLVTFLVTLAAVTAAHAAPAKLHPHGEELSKAPNPTITITRFAGNPDFNSASSLEWVQRDGAFYTNNRLSKIVVQGGNMCDSLLARQQYFPLQKMASTEYISAKDVMMYIKMSSGFHPGTVSMALANRELPNQRAEELFGPQRYQRLNPFFATKSEEQEIGKYVTASMWTVAGQYLDPKTGQVHHQGLPWQKDEKRKDLKLDRSKYKIVFEWGRAAQDMPREFEKLASAMSAMNYLDARALNAKIDDAWVMFHSFDKVNTRLYLSWFPGSIYPSDWQDKSDALFLVPLRKAMEVFPPSAHSGNLRDLIRSAHGRLTETSAIDFKSSADRIRLTQLDLHHSSGVRFPNPLIVHDLSTGSAYQRGRLVEQIGIDPDSVQADDLVHYLTRLLPVLPEGNLGQYTDASELELTQFEYTRRNAVEISNLDALVAEHDPQYIERVLIAANGYYIRKLSSDPMQMRTVYRWLTEQKIKIGLTTGNSQLANRIARLGPSESHDFGQVPRPDGTYVHLRSYFFTFHQLLNILVRNEELAIEAGQSLRENVWARHLTMSHLQPF